MKYIIQLNVNDIGSRPPLQEWEQDIPPEGYALCPDDFCEVFTVAKGFVNIKIENGIVTEITENTEAKKAWEAENPEKPPEPTVEEDMMNILVEQEYQITLLQLGL